MRHSWVVRPRHQRGHLCTTTAFRWAIRPAGQGWHTPGCGALPPPQLPSPHGNDTPWRSAPPAGTAAPKANSFFALQPPAVTRTQQRGMPTAHHKAAAPGVLTVRATVAAIEQGPSQVDAANAKPPKHWCSCRRAPPRSRTCAAHVTPVSCQRTLPCMPTAPQQQGVLHVQPRNNYVPTTPVCSLGQASSAC